MPYWRYCIIQHSARRTQRYDGRTDLTERHCCGETIVWDNTRWRCKHTKPAHKDAAVTCYTYLRVSRYVPPRDLHMLEAYLIVYEKNEKSSLELWGRGQM